MRDFQTAQGSRVGLSFDQLDLLENKVLPTARKWVREGSAMADHGRQTLAYWGEIPANPTGEQS